LTWLETSRAVEMVVKLKTKLKLLMFWMKYRVYIIAAVVIAVLLGGYFKFFRH